MTTNLKPLLGVALALLPLTVAACGGNDAGAATDNATNAEDARLKWEQCMREHGINIRESSGGGKATFSIQAPPRDKMQAADKACQKYRKGAFGNLTPEQREEFQDAFVRFAACMRQHGVDLPAPRIVTNGGGGAASGSSTDQGPDEVRIDPNDPTFKAAQEACQDKLPQGARGGPGGGRGIFIGPPPSGGSQ